MEGELGCRSKHEKDKRRARKPPCINLPDIQFLRGAATFAVLSWYKLPDFFNTYTHIRLSCASLSFLQREHAERNGARAHESQGVGLPTARGAGVLSGRDGRRRPIALVVIRADGRRGARGRDGDGGGDGHARLDLRVGAGRWGRRPAAAAGWVRRVRRPSHGRDGRRWRRHWARGRGGHHRGLGRVACGAGFGPGGCGERGAGLAKGLYVYGRKNGFQRVWLGGRKLTRPSDWNVGRRASPVVPRLRAGLAGSLGRLARPGRNGRLG